MTSCVNTDHIWSDSDSLVCVVTMANDVLRNQSDSPDSGMVLNLTFDPEVPRPPSVASIESVDNVVYSSALQDEVKEAWPMKCVYPVLEILNTEETYVLALRQMLEVHAVQLVHSN